MATTLSRKTVTCLLRNRGKLNKSRCLEELRKSAVQGFEAGPSGNGLPRMASSSSASTANWALDELIQKHGFKTHEEIYKFSIEKVSI